MMRVEGGGRREKESILSTCQMSVTAAAVDFLRAHDQTHGAYLSCCCCCEIFCATYACSHSILWCNYACTRCLIYIHRLAYAAVDVWRCTKLSHRLNEYMLLLHAKFSSKSNLVRFPPWYFDVFSRTSYGVRTEFVSQQFVLKVSRSKIFYIFVHF